MNTSSPLPAWFPQDFWDRFHAAAVSAGRPQRSLRWMALRVEQFVTALGPESTADLSERRITAFLDKVSRASQLPDWQLAQVFDAIELALDIISPDSSARVDSAFWRDAIPRPGPKHPTRARDEPVAPIAPPRAAIRPTRWEVQPECESLIRDVRRRHYAIKTEQAYLTGLRGYLGFVVAHGADALDPLVMRGYLDHLALNRNSSPKT